MCMCVEEIFACALQAKCHAFGYAFSHDMKMLWVTAISCQNSQWPLLYSNPCCVWDQWGESTVPVNILVNLCAAQPLLIFL